MRKVSYKLLNIILIESFFRRNSKVVFEAEDFNSHININVENKIDEEKLFVTVTLNFKAGSKKKTEIEAKIMMLGIFEYSENADLSVENFAKINAPAIIFPFIREHLASVSMKAGIPPILLPPINFVKLSKSKA